MTATQGPRTLEDLQNNPPDYAKETARLLFWSYNYPDNTPAALFLDIIGYSEDHYGEPLFDLHKCGERFGYLETDMLANALKEYAARPQDVMQYVEQYLEAEGQ